MFRFGWSILESSPTLMELSCQSNVALPIGCWNLIDAILSACHCMAMTNNHGGEEGVWCCCSIVVLMLMLFVVGCFVVPTRDSFFNECITAWSLYPPKCGKVYSKNQQVFGKKRWSCHRVHDCWLWTLDEYILLWVCHLTLDRCRSMPTCRESLPECWVARAFRQVCKPIVSN